jgi:hypothetical protein
MTEKLTPSTERVRPAPVDDGFQLLDDQERLGGIAFFAHQRRRESMASRNASSTVMTARTRTKTQRSRQ